VTTTVSAAQVCGSVLSLSPFVVITPVNNPPTADAGPPQTVEATSASGASVTLAGSGLDPDAGDTLSYAWSEGSTTLGTSATVTVVLPVGVHTVALTVTDSHGAVAVATTTVTVQDTTAPSVGMTAPAPGATVAGLVLVAANASDAVGVAGVEFFAGTQSLGVDSVPPYATVWDARLVPAGTSVEVSARAYDAAGNQRTARVSATVGTAEPPSIISAPPPTQIVAGQAFVHQMVASGTPLFIWALDAPPAGMTIDKWTGLIRWTPSAGQLGWFAIRVAVWNAAGTKGVQYWIKVVAPTTAAAGGTKTAQPAPPGRGGRAR
jgi:hypothetical protein